MGSPTNEFSSQTGRIPLSQLDENFEEFYDNSKILKPKFIQHAVQSITDADTTPDVSGGYLFKTANTGATIITDFDGGVEGQEIRVVFLDDNTTIDFTGTNLKGNGGQDWAPKTNDQLIAVYVGTTWYCDVVDANVFGLPSA